jgi:type I restriction enzyme S subunit
VIGEVRNIVENSTMKARIGWQGLTVSEYLDKGDYLLITELILLMEK